MHRKQLLFIGLFLTMIFSSSAQTAADSICPIKTSSEIPSSNVQNVQGETIDLKEYVGKKNAVLVFFRGAWCPYCLRHLSALNEIKPEMDSLDYELIAITPDQFSNLDSSEIRSGVDEFTLFSDANINAITNFGIGWEVSPDTYVKYKEKYNLDLEWWSGQEHHVLPVPAVFVIKDGVIRYQHVDPNYRQRLSAAVLLSFLLD